MQLVVQSGSEPGRTYDIAASQKIRMGRQSGNDVVVPDEQVSRRHAEIEERNGGLVVTDLGSSNGTFVNGTRITSAQTLQPGDMVQVGTTVLKVVGSPSSGGAGDYDQGATQVGGFQPTGRDYDAYNSPAAPNAPAPDYGQPSSGYDQGAGASGYGQSYGGPSGGSSPSPAAPSYDQGQNAYGGSSAAGSSYGGSSTPSYDQGQNAYGGSGQSAAGYGGSSPSPAAPSYDQGQGAYGGPAGGGSSYDQQPGQGAGGYGQQSSYGQSSQSPYGQSAGSYDPANPNAGAYGGSAAAGPSYGGGSYDPANPGAGAYGASAASYDPANPSAGAAYGQQGYNQGQGQPAYGGQQAYGQPGQYAQQGAYVPPAAPAAVKKRGGLPLPLIIVGAIVVLLIIAALVYFLVLNKGGAAVGDIPAPPNSTKIDISAQDIAKLNPDVDQANISKVNYGFYASNDSSASLLTFYQNEMKNRGWTQDMTQSDATGGLFKKGDQSAGLALLPITSDAQLTGLNGAFPAMNGKIKVGQTMVIVASGPSSVFKTTPGA